MSVDLSVKERIGSLSGHLNPRQQEAINYFTTKEKLRKVILGERDFKILRALFENKVVSREQINNQFFPGVSKETVNRRLRKIADLGLITRKSTVVGRRVIWCYSLTSRGLAKIKPTLPYEVKTKATRSECPLHDTVLYDIRKAFEARSDIQGYYTENVLQTRMDFRDNEWFQPFIKLNSDAMAEVDSKVGTLHLAIEFDMTHKNNRRYRRKLNAYYRQPKIDGVLYICADEYILHALQKLDSEAAKRHHCHPKLYLALLDNVIGEQDELRFQNANKRIFCVC